MIIVCVQVKYLSSGDMIHIIMELDLKNASSGTSTKILKINIDLCHVIYTAIYNNSLIMTNYP